MPEAQYALGKLLLSDDWEVRDPDEGIRWLKQAAENGSHFAAYRLGKEYLEGNAVNKDTTRAADWFTKSAEAGNQYAQYMLGKLCLTGQGLSYKIRHRRWCGSAAPPPREIQYAQFFLEQQKQSPPALCDAGGHSAALPHEPDLPGQLRAVRRPDGPAGGSKTQAEDPGEEDRYGPQAG